MTLGFYKLVLKQEQNLVFYSKLALHAEKPVVSYKKVSKNAHHIKLITIHSY